MDSPNAKRPYCVNSILGSSTVMIRGWRCSPDNTPTTGNLSKLLSAKFSFRLHLTVQTDFSLSTVSKVFARCANCGVVRSPPCKVPWDNVCCDLVLYKYNWIDKLVLLVFSARRPSADAHRPSSFMCSTRSLPSHSQESLLSHFHCSSNKYCDLLLSLSGRSLHTLLQTSCSLGGSNSTLSD